jgi:hypothetical protein
MSEYQQKKKKIHDYLGSGCVVCGTSKNLHIDHIDASTKCFTILTNWAYSWSILEPELKKCQLLCKTHHLEKSISCGDLISGGWNKINHPSHGTSIMYGKYKCRCGDCKQWKKDYRIGLVDSQNKPL